MALRVALANLGPMANRSARVSALILVCLSGDTKVRYSGTPVPASRASKLEIGAAWMAISVDKSPRVGSISLRYAKSDVGSAYAYLSSCHKTLGWTFSSHWTQLILELLVIFVGFHDNGLFVVI